MDGRESFGSIGRPSDSGSGGSERPEFIGCVDGREPHIHEVWAFGSNGVTREVHPTAQLDVGTGVVGYFVTNYLTESGRRIPILGRISMNGSVEWLGVPDFHRTNGPACTDNLLAHGYSWGDRGTTTNQNWGSQSGVDSVSVSFPWNRPVRVLPVYCRRISKNMRAAARRVRDDHLRSNRLAHIRSPSTSRNPIQNRRVNWRGCDWDGPVGQ